MSTTEGTTMTLEENQRRHVIGDAIVAAFMALCSRKWHTEIQASDALLREHTGDTFNVRVSSRVAYLARRCKRCGCEIRVNQKQALRLAR